MAEEIIFEELGKNERTLLLRAFDYNVDSNGYVLTPAGQRIRSKENPSIFIKAEFASLVPGSLEVIDGTPTAISEFLRKREQGEEANDCSGNNNSN